MSHYRARAVAVHATSADIGNVHVHVLGHVAAPSAESSGVSSGGVDDGGWDASLGFGSMAAVILAGLDAAASACTGGKQHDVVTCDFRGLKVKNIPLNPPPPRRRVTRRMEISNSTFMRREKNHIRQLKLENVVAAYLVYGLGDLPRRGCRGRSARPKRTRRRTRRFCTCLCRSPDSNDPWRGLETVSQRILTILIPLSVAHRRVSTSGSVRVYDIHVYTEPVHKMYEYPRI